jgi:hypothetical protein
MDAHTHLRRREYSRVEPTPDTILEQLQRSAAAEAFHPVVVHSCSGGGIRTAAFSGSRRLGAGSRCKVSSALASA